MWPSRETASWVYNLANWGLIGGLLVGAAATALIVWMGNVKEAYLKLDVSRANAVAETAKLDAAKVNERAAGLESQSAAAQVLISQARNEAARANERAAMLDKEAKEAKLEQEKLKAQLSWRTLTPKMIEQLTAALQPTQSSVTLACIAHDPEALFLTIQISEAFKNAKWNLRNESRSYARRIIFGIVIPGPDNENVAIVRKAFAAAGIPFAIEDVPPAEMTYSDSSTTPVTVIIGSRRPVF